VAVLMRVVKRCRPLRFPDAVQRAKRVYARERAIAAAPQIRDRSTLSVCKGPGSAAHHFMLRCARDTMQYRRAAGPV
jgi:hypothetical protein